MSVHRILSRSRSLPAALVPAAAFVAGLVAPAVAEAQSPFDGLAFRSIGPAVMGGRVHDVEVDPKDPFTIYVAAAGGGLWKSTNKGTTWAPIFDQQDDNSFGDLAISPIDSRILWAGTGEQNNRQSSTWGGGVYRSTNAGATWTHIGLRNSGSIGRVIAHPTDVNVAYVAAVGDLWKPSTERGVYRTSDAGKTWTRLLYVDSLTGASELVMDPRDPNVLYATTYQRLRSAFGFNGGGPGSALWKSTDGGATWRKLTNGIPDGDKGRIGLALARTNPNILIATIEHATGSGVYRSEDAGASWKRMSGANPRPMYYSAPTIDPTNDQRIWLMNVQPMKSEDGGATFEQMPNSPTYDLGLKDDHHALWIDPRDSRHVLLGGDGGLHESFDLGYTYTRLNGFAVGQFYRIAVDDRDPYYIYGGMQDAHSWMGPSATRHWLGILNQDWVQIGFSDGTGQAVDKKGHRFVYSTSSGGNLTRVDAESGDRWDIQPIPPKGETYRYDWTAPIVASKHKAGTVYLGANKLLISRDFGTSWTASPDLTRKVNRDTLKLAGVLNTAISLSRNDGEDNFSEITTIAESPVDGKVLWVGTDDGNVQVSRDGGTSWLEVSHNITGVKDGSFVDRLVASESSPGTAYVTFENHRSGDFAPYIFRTSDFGATWTAVTTGLPTGNPVRSLAEFPGHAGVLFAGTERFLYVTRDAGAHWTRVKANLPPMRIDDIVVHPRTKDLILATHGRSIWVLDDASPFVQWSEASANTKAMLLPVRQATLVMYREDISTMAHGFYAAENPAEGAVFTYAVSGPATTVTFTVKNAGGAVVRTFTAPAAPGVLNRTNWDLRYAAVGGGFAMAAGGEGGPPAPPTRGGRGTQRPALPLPAHTIGARGITVAPGTYTVTMEAAGESHTETFTVRADPVSPVSVADQRMREAFLLDVLDVQAKLTAALTAFRTKLAAAKGAEAERLNAVAVSLGITTGGGRGGRAGRGGGAPGAALGGIVSSFSGSGVQHGSFQRPTRTHQAALADAKAALATLQVALDGK